MKLSAIAEEQLTEIQYAFGCSKAKAISYALESLHAFENITQDQVYNFLDDNYKPGLMQWEETNKDKRVSLQNN